ncbi:MAG: SDR family NAD(P)-dependent oxidoreductase [Bacteroidota bacterium]|nr:SDR family NAD(P)-dependent oxidoreductase [Candidatus Kapabacteria bacterium]MCS7302754.1 SDR family NAD(P)-dependent oxidoreductase [Candidatus Kapabacteria bacterium]MCX7937229.1 SDR family NAD(P)-dependent oxidoreductase [Chlorobiota bacterium]MDW8075758.1 SDR family NAD(P)-dependent oxidoreductase [Bacteroidota bacterium]MDW8272505.1 SDR family NAD(P)-dependent oxidoreductase [Bacteroidota bacterium]
MPIALITGANRGIGLALAQELGDRGFHVIVGSRVLQRGEEAVATLRQQGISAETIPIDMEQPETFIYARDRIAALHGVLDVLVNNAGVMLESSGWNVNTTTTISPDVLRRTFQVNFFGPVELTQLLLPLLEKSTSARIVNMSTILASLELHATPGSNTYDTKTFGYNSSKTALNAFTVHLAHALRNTNIKVIGVHPGWVKTELGGEGALITPQQAARPIADLITAPDPPTGVVIFRGKPLPW